MTAEPIVLMCGIAGFVSQDSGPHPLTIVGRMLPAIAHRGPDGEGVAEWPHAALGHRRLAIIDLSDAGKQPMLSADGQVGLVFNGCIYNFQAIRKELESLGHRFQSQCDTEVLLQGYLAWGIEGLVRQLRGMFAFGVWDNRTRELHLVRDRLGVKPLVYAETARGIAFASTVNALQDAGFGGPVDAMAVLEFLEFGFVTDERCIFEKLRKLPPGHILSWREGKHSVSRYWQLAVEQDAGISFEDAVTETERLLLEAVQLRLVADVPVGALLSGGIDSGLICWALRELNADIRSFTVGTPGDADDETGAAQATAATLGIPNDVVTLPRDENAPLKELCTAYAEPFASTSALGVLRVSKAVKAHATVLLTGDGGDDIYLGYPFLLNAWRAQRLAGAVPGFAAKLWPAVDPLMKAIPAARSARSFLSYSFGGIGAYARVRIGIPYFDRHQVLGPKLAGLRLSHRERPSSIESGRRLLDDVCAFHWRHHFLGEFMTKVDGATMLHALEARSPFLDHKMWEFAARLPYSVRFHGGKLKAVLREIARRRLGDQVASRTKQGFTIPAERWLLDRWSSDLRTLAESSVAAGDGWFEQEALRRLVTSAQQTRETPPQLWHAVVLEHWLRNRVAGAGAT